MLVFVVSVLLNPKQASIYQMLMEITYAKMHWFSWKLWYFPGKNILQLLIYFHAKYVFFQYNPLIRPHKMAFSFNCLLSPCPTNSIRFAEKQASS